MPFYRESLDGLRAIVRAGYRSAMPGASDALQLRYSRIGVTADVQADVANHELGYIDWTIDGALMPDTCEAEYLDRWGGFFGMPRQGPASAAGPVIFSGVPGLPISAGQGLTLQGGSIAYATQGAATVGSGGTVSVNVLATVGGAAGNLAAGQTLNVNPALAGSAATATVDAAGLTGGRDTETDNTYRARILYRMQNPPQGGAPSDYVLWALAYPGVTRAWCYPCGRGPGTVNVAVMFDGRANPFPLTADCTAIAAAIMAVSPCQDVVVFAPTPVPVNVTTSGVPTANQSAVLAELADLFGQQAPGGAKYGSGVSPANVGGLLRVTQIESAIEAGFGSDAFDLSAPTSDQTAATGTMLTLGTATIL